MAVIAHCLAQNTLEVCLIENDLVLWEVEAKNRCCGRKSRSTEVCTDRRRGTGRKPGVSLVEEEA